MKKLNLIFCIGYFICSFTFCMHNAVKSFTELGPKLLEVSGVNYLLSEVFSQDPLERYFSHQQHRGGSNDNPTAEQVQLNAMTLIQQQTVYRDLKTMNVQSSQDTTSLSQISEPLKKKPRKRRLIYLSIFMCTIHHTRLMITHMYNSHSITNYA